MGAWPDGVKMAIRAGKSRTGRSNDENDGRGSEGGEKGEKGRKDGARADPDPKLHPFMPRRHRRLGHCRCCSPLAADHDAGSDGGSARAHGHDG